VDLSIADLNRRLGRRDEALKALETVERVHGPDARIHLVRGLIHNSAGDHQQALPELEQARGTPSTEDAACYHIGLTLRALGKTQEAISIFEMLTRRNARDFDAWYEIARCRLLLADRAGMFAALDRAAGVSRTRIRKRLTVDPDFQEVREDPRFRQVTEG
jgi:tetratricopeptide (TPR) repeat protein